MIASQLEQTAGQNARHLIHVHEFNLEKKSGKEIQSAANTLITAAKQTELFAIMDECIIGNNSQWLTALCTELQRRLPRLHLWIASLWMDLRPPLLTDVTLTQPLRTPPSITRHVQQNLYMNQDQSVRGYTAVQSPLPCDGPTPRIVLHCDTGRGGHSAGTATECLQCGREVATILHDLNVGQTGRGGKSPNALRYSDVFILSYWNDLHDTETDVAGNTTRLASGVLQGIREAGVPVTVLKTDDVIAIRDVATMAGRNQVVAAYCEDVQGLERKVVVFIQGGNLGTVDEDDARLKLISRCTAQLVWVRRQH